MDMLRWIVIIGGIALLAALAAAMRLAWENAGSKTIVLATAALSGAAILFVVQAWFELQSSTSHNYVGVEYTVNHATASVGQWSYADVVRAREEINASNWLHATDTPAFDRESQRVAADLAMFSLVSFLAWEEYDWQLERVQFTGDVMPGVTLTESPSTDNESTAVEEADLRNQLSRVKNIFAGAPDIVAERKLRLPPKSTLDIQQRSIIIRNAVCRVTWELQPPFSVFYIDPRTKTASPKLPSGKQKLETFGQRFKVSVTYFALHSQRRDISKYRAWTTRLLTDCHRWFEERGATLFADNGVPQ